MTRHGHGDSLRPLEAAPVLRPHHTTGLVCRPLAAATAPNGRHQVAGTIRYIRCRPVQSIPAPSPNVGRGVDAQMLPRPCAGAATAPRFSDEKWGADMLPAAIFAQVQ